MDGVQYSAKQVHMNNNLRLNIPTVNFKTGGIHDVEHNQSVSMKIANLFLLQSLGYVD